jgi:Papain family cysteine protease
MPKPFTPAAALMLLLLAAQAGHPAAADTEPVDAEAVQAQKAKRGKALRTADRWAVANPERYAKLVPPGASLAPRGVEITWTDRFGNTRQAVADSLLQTKVALGYAELNGRNKGHLGRVYTHVWNLMPERYREGLPPPSAVIDLPVYRLRNHLAQLGKVMVRDFDLIRRDISETVFLPWGLLVNPIGVCSNEVGWEAGGIDNENSDRCELSEYASLGLMANLDFALKDDLTCVKDQRRRGTCSVHAVAANVETMIQVMGGVPTNLAEQELYLFGKIFTDWSNRYVDGLSADEVYDELDAQNRSIQYEATWNYNQSPARGSLSGITFPNSCDFTRYTGEMCTDFAFQSLETFTGANWLYTVPALAAAGWEVLDWTSIPDLSSVLLPDWQVDVAILSVEAEYPVHLSFNTATSFRNPDANGYVQYNPADPVPTGAHAILAVGFVANADLPAGVPTDPDGRGYFIIKNSWGTDYGDCGFSYLSTEFVRQWAYGFRYLEKTVTFR